VGNNGRLIRGIEPLPFAPLDDAAYHGPAGDYARLIEPFTEADPASLIIQLLVIFGNIIGHKPRRFIDGVPHYTNLYHVKIGESSRSRKGSSFGRVYYFILSELEAVLRGWKSRGGLISGEGILFHVRDSVEKPNKDGNLETVDEGVNDKRSFYREAEFSKALKNGARPGSTLDDMLCLAWDTGNLQNSGRGSKDCATNAHVSLIGDITPHMLNRLLTEEDIFSGFANRILWTHAHRTKSLAWSGVPDSEAVKALVKRLAVAIQNAERVGWVGFTPKARAMYASIYEALTTPDYSEIMNTMLGRAAPMVIRLAMIYALLDCKAIVDEAHLWAALAVWEYSERTVLKYFGKSTGNAVADKILKHLVGAPDGLTISQINDLFSGHRIEEIKQAFDELRQAKLATETKEGSTGGRPAVRWRATPKAIAGDEQATSYISLVELEYLESVLAGHEMEERALTARYGTPIVTLEDEVLCGMRR
jgi:hypothetical protein